MAEKDPIRLNLDGDGNPDGFAEFQSADFIGLTDGGTGGSYSSLADLRIGLGLQIGSDVQAYDADLTTLANITHSDGVFIVSDGTQWVSESGATARTSLGLGTGDSPTFTGLTTTGSVTIQGNLDVQGEFLNTTAEVIVVDDAFIQLNTGNSEVDAGIIVETSDTDDARLFYDVSTNRWVLGENQSYDEILTQTSTDTITNKSIDGGSNTLTNIPNTAFSNSSITVTDGSNSTDISLGGTITFTGGTGLTLTEGSGTVTGSVDFTEFDTDNITEGSTNLYYTNARADARIALANIEDLANVGFSGLANGDVIRYNGSSWINDPIDLATDTVGDFVQNLVAGTGISVSTTSGESQTPTIAVTMSSFDTDDLTEGSSNLYYTDARSNSAFDTRLATKDTDDLSEGSTNLYYTDTRVGSYLTSNSYATQTYVDSAVATENEISEMNDVTLTSLAANQVLRYSGSAWLNVTLDTDDIGEGSTNLYYTDARFDTRLATKDTDDLTEGTNLYYTTARFDTRLGTKDTDDLSEGSTNLYFTNARARGSLSVTDAGGDGSLSYDNTTGVFTYTGPSASEVRAHLSVTDSGGDGSLAYNSSTGVITYTGPSASEVQAHITAGTGVSISSGEVSIGQAVGTTDNVQFNNVQVDGTLTSDDITSSTISIDGDATITGDLTVSGTTTTVNSTTVTIDDPLVRYADNNLGNSVDFGFYGKYVQSSTTKYGGLVWDASQSDKFRLFSGLQSEPTTTVDITGTGYTLGTLLANIEGDLTGDVTGTVSDISNHDTDSLSEGSSNLYYTTTRANTDFDTKLAAADTGDLSEGTNLYYTTARFDSALSGKTTSDLAEGTNLYFTNERVDDQVDSLLTAGSNITLSYDDSAGTLTISATEDDLSNNDTDDLSEGSSNLYFTNERAQDALGTALTMGTQTLITVTYDDTNNNFDFVVDNDLSNYDNSTSAFTTLASFSGGTNISFSSGTIAFDNTSDLDMGGRKVLFGNVYSAEGDLPSASTYHGMFAHVHGTGRAYYAHAGNWVDLIGANEIGSGLTYSSGSLTADFTPTSTDTVTNKTINFEDNTAIVEFAVTVSNSGSGNKYYLDGEEAASIQLVPGITYRFDLSDSSTSSHPFLLSTTKDGSHNSGSSYTTGVTTNGSQGSSGAYVQITINAATSDTLYYYCSAHSGMGGDAVVSIAGSSLSASDTDDLTEGSSNLYYTDARVRGAVSVTDSGGDGSLSYNSGSGVFTYTGPSASETRAHFSAGTGVALSSGEISIGQAVGTTSDVTFNDLVVSGDLTVSGTTTTLNTETLTVDDNIIVLNNNVTGSPTENAGIEIERGSSTNKTLIWNETDDKWTVGLERFDAGSIYSTFTGNLTGNVTGTVSSIANHDTDNLSEGSSNLYFTDERVDDRVNALLTEGTNVSLTYDDSANTLTITSTDTNTQLSQEQVEDYVAGVITAGTDISVTYDDSAGTLTIANTASLSTEQVQDITGAQIVTNGSHTGISFSYDDANDGAIDATVSLSGFSTSDLSEGTNLYYTDARFDTRLGTKDTDNLSEGSTNLYFTNARADARIAAANVNDLNDIIFSDPTSSDDAKVISYSDTSGGFVLSSLAGLSGSGEVNTASNSNVAGVGVFKQKTGEDLEFRGINAGSTKITVTNDTSNDEIDIDLGTVSIDHLSDVDTTTSAPTSGQALKWSGSQWEPGDASSQVSQLTDVTLTSLATDDLLVYNGTNWVNTTLDTDDVAEGSTNLYYTDARAQASITGGTGISNTSGTIAVDFSEFDTDSITEGSTNLFYTNARVQSYLSGGTGVTLNGSGEFSIGQAVGTTDNVTFNDMTVSGNFTVSGTTTTVNTETINLADNTITLNSNATGSASEDGGIEIERGDDTNKTLIWNETTDKWTVGSETFVAGTFEGEATNIQATAITDLTEDTSPAEGDYLVTYDVSASSLKKVQKSNIAAAVSFSVNDELPLTLADSTSDPIEFTNVGTSATDLDLTLADGTVDPINITGTSNSATTFRDGDTDTFIRVESSNTDNDEIEMHTAGSERVTIDSTGVVDIASAKLEIAGAAGSANQVLTTDGSGTISWADAAGGDSDKIEDADGDTKIQVEESSDEDKIRFDTGGTERLVIDSGGADFSVPVIPPNLTTTQIDALTGMTGGEITYDTTLDKLKLYNIGNTEWETISTEGSSGITATGGTTQTYTVDGVNYQSHTFTSSGTFQVTAAGASSTVDVLLIAGGGAGGADNAGGGGAGGLLTQTSLSVSAQNYSIVIGAGGSKSTSTDGNGAAATSGTNTTGFSYTATGGGQGGSAGTANNAGNGGSGGGLQGAEISGSAGTGISGQGNNGGGSNNTGGGGGGGGAGAAGTSATSAVGGSGGNGLNNDYQTGSDIAYAGGGAGGNDNSNNTNVSGGSGGGADSPGQDGTPSAGAANKGGGGAGGTHTGNVGSNGGSGIVIVRYTI